MQRWVLDVKSCDGRRGVLCRASDEDMGLALECRV